jgi:CRISPR-associated exonuclease Cas4
VQSFSDLATAAYCPRKLYYRRKHDDYELPEEAAAIRALATRYDELFDPETDLAAEPVAVTPTQYRSNLGSLRARLDCWEDLVDPPATAVVLEGKDCRGTADKLLSEPQPVPTVVSPGEPPEQGVWQPQSVRATAAAKALAWEREEPIERALVEYPAYGIVREVRLTTRRKAAYRRALRAARSVDGPPPRLDDDARCGACEYRTECGVETASLRSRLSL